jgi:hypothetical protein
MFHSSPPWYTLHPLRTMEEPPLLKRRNQSIGEFNILDVRFKISDFRFAICHQLFAYSPLVQFEIPCYFFTVRTIGDEVIGSESHLRFHGTGGCLY